MDTLLETYNFLITIRLYGFNLLILVSTRCKIKYIHDFVHVKSHFVYIHILKYVLKIQLNIFFKSKIIMIIEVSNDVNFDYYTLNNIFFSIYSISLNMNSLKFEKVTLKRCIFSLFMNIIRGKKFIKKKYV